MHTWGFGHKRMDDGELISIWLFLVVLARCALVAACGMAEVIIKANFLQRIYEEIITNEIKLNNVNANLADSGLRREREKVSINAEGEREGVRDRGGKTV